MKYLDDLRIYAIDTEIRRAQDEGCKCEVAPRDLRLLLQRAEYHDQATSDLQNVQARVNEMAKQLVAERAENATNIAKLSEAVRELASAVRSGQLVGGG